MQAYYCSFEKWKGINRKACNSSLLEWHDFNMGDTFPSLEGKLDSLYKEDPTSILIYLNLGSFC
jgi:hypothetical protein